MNDYFKQIADHAHAVPGQEVCGLLHFDYSGSLIAVRATNAAHDPSKRFEIPDREYLAAIKRGGLAAYYHSHFEGPPVFSEEDIKRSETAELPLFCYSTFTKTFNLHRPLRSIPHYLGRQFVLGFQDCAALVTDYYQREIGLTLPYFARPVTMLENGFPNLRQYLLDAGFLHVPHGEELINGDILAFAVATPNNTPNHVGVKTSHGMMYHQLAGRFSDSESIGVKWTDRLVFAMRLSRELQR